MPEMGFYWKYSFVLSLRRYSALILILKMLITNTKNLYKKFIKILFCNAGLVSDRRVRISVSPLKRALLDNWPIFLSFSTTIENRCKRNWPKMFFKRWEGTTFVVKLVPHSPLGIT